MENQFVSSARFVVARSHLLSAHNTTEAVLSNFAFQCLSPWRCGESCGGCMCMPCVCAQHSPYIWSTLGSIKFSLFCFSPLALLFVFVPLYNHRRRLVQMRETDWRFSLHEPPCVCVRALGRMGFCLVSETDVQCSPAIVFRENCRFVGSRFSSERESVKLVSVYMTHTLPGTHHPPSFPHMRLGWCCV